MVTHQAWSTRCHDEPSHLFLGKAKHQWELGLGISSPSLIIPQPSLTLCTSSFFIISGANYTNVIDLHPLPCSPNDFSSRSDVFCLLPLRVHRSRIFSRPSEDSVSVVVIPSSSALGNSRTADTLAAMRSFFNVDSTVTTCRLVGVRKNYVIPPEYELHVPLLGEHPYDAFTCAFGLSTDALEAGLRFPLYPAVEVCLK
ncbi:hypothetical protein BHM03_00042056 [Ensete ventricosum]|nr:hypothetical protein BHM03_00042056 [Ensete ventricosum]